MNYDNIINKKENSIKLMHPAVFYTRDSCIFKTYYSWWASSIMANAPCRRQGHPSSIPGSSTATIKLNWGRK